MAETVEAEASAPAPVRIGDVAHFTPDAFIVDPEVAQETIARKHLSPSTMNTLAEDCNAAWAASKVLPFDDSPESPAGAGGWVHLAFERFYSLPAAERSSEALAEQVNRVAAEAADGDLARMQLLSAKYRHLAWGIFQLEDPTDVEVHSVEQKLFTEIDGVPVQGTIDRTDVVDGKLVLRDFKTGKVPKPRYDTYPHAMRTYALIYEQIYGELPAEAWLYYTRDDIAVAKEIDLSDQALAKTRRRLAQQWQKHTEQIEAAAFPTQTGPLCGWCPMVDLCPAAAAEGRTVDKRASMTPLVLDEQNLDDPLEVLAAAEAAQALGGDLTAADFADAGHSADDADQTRQHPRTEAPEETPMRIDETPTYEKYTRDGDMNPSSWAVNNLFTLRAAATDAINAYAETLDEDIDVYELSHHVFREVTLTVGGAQREWLGVGPDTQAASFNRLTHVAKDFLATRETDFADDEQLSAFLDEMSAEMLTAIDQVHEVFELLDDEAEAIAADTGEDTDGGGPWRS